MALNSTCSLLLNPKSIPVGLASPWNSRVIYSIANLRSPVGYLIIGILKLKMDKTKTKTKTNFFSPKATLSPVSPYQ